MKRRHLGSFADCQGKDSNQYAGDVTDFVTPPAKMAVFEGDETIIVTSPAR